MCARARETAIEAAFSSAFSSLQARRSEQKAAAACAEGERAELRASVCSTVWSAARYGVPVRTLREMMSEKMFQSRNFDPSEPFDQLCRRVEGVVVESRHPYPKGVRQDIEAYVANADSFYVAFDAASNATIGMGKVALQEFNARDPKLFFPRGPYNVDTSGEARLPGVDGERPMRVQGSSVLVTFSASYWTGVAPAGEDYGWRLVCFTADDDDHAKALVSEAERAADRAEAVDAVNTHGETCLHVASFEGNVPAVRYLLSVDADPNSAHSASGYNTPLHEAARGGSLAVTRLLLKSSANVLAVNSHGDHPLHVACREGRLDIARRLLAHDSDWATVAARNHAGLRPVEVVPACSALIALLKEVEVRAANASMAQAALAANATPSGLQADPCFHQRNNKNGGGKPVSAAGVGRCGGRGGVLRRQARGGGRRNKSGLGRLSSSSDGALAKAMLSGSILPRWARLARPFEDELHRQQRSLKDRGCPQGPQRRGVEEVGSGGVTDNAGSVASEGSDAQSVAGWSGTSYGASLAESDFAIPPAEVVVAGRGSSSGGGGLACGKHRER
ncbi:Chain A, Crystal Structure Of The Bard1 Ankyrin Repeat Domain And Its Functional Consequences pdb/3C5R/B Chain B, Crystal Structure Of The Bard1 Ankyrin Repeat Domain And Its Functional Consequences [Ectocarpus siliculosus]|uniref:Chain A, Crystal Structure Of The Bard1 Ankyrin Repeat Domain And Its Functional Consequences pdb 3C5R B Chain B, Crystal Structure Of The Bard1 Ankyrin Repeat Domain And Its Functional Consequences n=1 Tax=Ectocarpus siliculosus TaxID=2880 RepID=D7FQ61_ECTSI|nr:Chain A, Crystal Structure Of The Bard1 Ankyrin Repeat Domain And Its Functional Consequences pdb/3C5R/B Chain B, Crystal Structure Of The Bard1 Ankyrin Repeat Domain And Its Functional Consequences [Ectocarpus siliculosus]|eukprot:CBJ48393.1 Chain A, Crystal Structure Of The Bard1 Ankyrin Repeat Domain And Its Functional Consequences pdb/3C5R/B Chain B, Crystal Structure Of The Bard1 Ankyrin Repeat Domain And Its Functional Consequences [Ectocarpus siliculosus]